MKANCSYNSGELWTVCVSLNTGKKWESSPGEKTLNLSPKNPCENNMARCLRNTYEPEPLVNIPARLPYLKMNYVQIREERYLIQDHKASSCQGRELDTFLLSYCAVLCCKSGKCMKKKGTSFTTWFFSLFDITEHLGGVSRKLIIPSPPHCIHRACINSQCESSLPFVTVLKSNFLFMFYMLLESLWCSDFPLHSILFNSLELFGSNSSRNNYHAGDHGAMCTHVGRLLSIRGYAGCWRKEII